MSTEIEEVIKDENIEDINNDNNPIVETLDNNSKDDFKNTVTKRNEEAQRAKEELNPIVEEEEEEEPNNFLKYVGFGLLGISIVGFILNKNSLQKPTNSPNIENEIK